MREKGQWEQVHSLVLLLAMLIQLGGEDNMVEPQLFIFIYLFLFIRLISVEKSK